jgi:sucrose phosphorylase
MDTSEDTYLRNQVQLITYPDSLGGTLVDLTEVLDTYLDGAIGGVHILPFYPSSADRGFAPLTHLSVDPKFGTWDDVAAIAKRYDLVADLTVNHMSCMSPYFQDFLKKGNDSKYAKMFLDVDTYLERHGTTIDSLSTTYRPRPTLPFTEFRFADGVTRKLWTTFTNHQVDLDLTQQVTRDIMVRFIERLAEHGVRLIRLDAVGYTMKKPWTNSFLIPETYDFMGWIRSVTPPGVELLAEVHHNAEKQRSMLETEVTDWVYDFSLPMLVLHGLFTGEAAPLKNWITVRPTNQVTVLDTHDGIGVIDVEGLMTSAEIAHTVAEVERRGAKAAYRASGTQAQNVDIYQVNTTYYSALGEEDDAYIAARAIQFFVPGVPQVYYVGLLAGSNDFESFEKTKHGRDVNRHNYTNEEIALNMERGVVQRLLRLMHLRSTHPAFNGVFTLRPSRDHELILRWERDDLYCEARVDLTTNSVEIEQVRPDTGVTEVRVY